MKVRYDLFLYRQSRMHSPTFISVYETTDESETARIWPRRHVQSLESSGPLFSHNSHITPLSPRPILHRRPFLTLIAILHPTLPPRPPVLRRPHRTRLLLHQLPGRHAALPKAGAGTRSHGRHCPPDLRRYRCTRPPRGRATTGAQPVEGEEVVAVPECNLVRPGAERHLQLLKPAPAPHRACGLRPRR